MKVNAYVKVHVFSSLKLLEKTVLGKIHKKSTKIKKTKKSEKSDFFVLFYEKNLPGLAKKTKKWKKREKKISEKTQKFFFKLGAIYGEK